MRLSTNGFQGPPRDPEAGRAVLRRAVELGVNHIDTAAFYQSRDGSVRANTLIREALSPYPPDLVIATKVGPVPDLNGPAQGTAADLRAQVEDNLKTLGLERLDLVYLRIGMMEPPHGESLAERFEALAAMREEGLIRHLGLSNVDTAHLTEARAIAPVVAIQNHFHIAKRDDVAVLDACAADGIAFAPSSLWAAAGATSTITAWARSRPGTARPSRRSPWPGSWPSRQSPWLSPALAPLLTWRRTSPPVPSPSPRRTSPTSPDGEIHLAWTRLRRRSLVPFLSMWGIVCEHTISIYAVKRA